MTTAKLYNNLGIESLAIIFVLQNVKVMPLTKALLILPIFSHRELLAYLSNGHTKIQSTEKLIIEKTSFFANFNDRFYDSLCGSINAIQFLHEIGFLEVKDGNILAKSAVLYEKSMGARADKINKAAGNIAKLLSDGAEKLYLNFRVEL
jgi:hypothetical protein